MLAVYNMTPSGYFEDLFGYQRFQNGWTFVYPPGCGNKALAVVIDDPAHCSGIILGFE